MLRTIVQLFGKAPNEWTQIERNLCGRRAAWSPLYRWLYVAICPTDVTCRSAIAASLLVCFILLTVSGSHHLFILATGAVRPTLPFLLAGQSVCQQVSTVSSSSLPFRVIGKRPSPSKLHWVYLLGEVFMRLSFECQRLRCSWLINNSVRQLCLSIG